MSLFDKRLQPIADYLDRFPKEAEQNLAGLKKQLTTDQDMFNRKNYRGHITTSLILFKEALKEILLIHHIGLNTWIQPGGHFENDKDLWASALRELKEETGICSVQLMDWGQPSTSMPFDINTHPIPACPSKSEVAHVHHDCLFLASLSRNPKIKQQIEEIKDFAWKPVMAPDISPRLRHVIAKARAYGLF